MRSVVSVHAPPRAVPASATLRGTAADLEHGSTRRVTRATALPSVAAAFVAGRIGGGFTESQNFRMLPWSLLPVSAFSPRPDPSPMNRSRSPLTIIFITVFIDLLGFGLVLPALPFYAESYGAAPIMVGLLSMSYSLMQFLFAPLWGTFGQDRAAADYSAQSRRLLRRFTVFGLADSLVMLFVAGPWPGCFRAPRFPPPGLHRRLHTPENRAKGMGLIARPSGWASFSARHGRLADTLRLRLSLDRAAVMAGLNFIWACTSFPKPCITASGASALRI